MAVASTFEEHLARARRERRVVFARDVQIERERYLSEQRRESMTDMLCGSFSRVYFVQAVHGGLIKIGRTSDLAKRLTALQVSCPCELRLLALIDEGSSLYGVTERQLHDRFVLQRAHGEWFGPSTELLEFIAQRTVLLNLTVAEVITYVRTHSRQT